MSVLTLILTSDPALRDALRWAAEEFGPVVVTNKPAMAIYRAAVHEPLVAVVDLDAVPPDGRSGLLSTLRTRFQIAIVGVGHPAVTQDATSLGLTEIVAKPVNVGKVMAAIDRILGERARRSSPLRDQNAC